MFSFTSKIKQETNVFSTVAKKKHFSSNCNMAGMLNFDLHLYLSMIARYNYEILVIFLTVTNVPPENILLTLSVCTKIHVWTFIYVKSCFIILYDIKWIYWCKRCMLCSHLINTMGIQTHSELMLFFDSTILFKVSIIILTFWNIPRK